MSSGRTQPLYLISDGGELRKKGVLVEAIAAALEGASGAVSFVQLREQAGAQAASDDEVLALAAAIKPYCRKWNARLIVNRSPQLLSSALFDGIHLGARGPSMSAVRLSRPGAIIGYSAHSVSEAQSAFDDQADYVFLSPIFHPRSKEFTGEPLGLEPLQQLSAFNRGAVYALGGITPSNASSCRLAGAAGIAVISSVILEANQAEAAQRIVAAWSR